MCSLDLGVAQCVSMADAHLGGIGDSNNSSHGTLSDTDQPERVVFRAASVGAPVGSTSCAMSRPLRRRRTAMFSSRSSDVLYDSRGTID